MKLEKFKEKNTKRKVIVIFTVCCVLLLAGVFLYTSFAVFTEEKQFNVINGTYQDPGDLYFAVYLDGEITNTFPSKNEGYLFDITQSSCTNGATVSWDEDSWSALVNFSNYQAGNLSKIKCTMYFKKQLTATEYITSLANTSTDLIYDGTSDNNLRYIGADPDNYVSFNNELWRIIGVMNNIDDGNGTLESRIKIIRNEPIGSYSWDNKANGVGSSISDYGSNDWSDSALQIVLNSGAYYNRTSGECPYGQNGSTISCDFTNSGLTEEAKAMISNAVWNLGGSSTYNGLTASMFYVRERGDSVYSGRPTEWTGQIGLMYPSDYGYATSGGSTGRDTCLATELYNWYNSSYSDCKNNDWFFNSSNAQWTITPISSSYSADVFFVNGLGGEVTSNYVGYVSYTVSPALYLTSNVKITGGNGSQDNPYILSVE